MTHRKGNQFDQMWTRNIAILNAIVADPIDQVSDHSLIKIVLKPFSLRGNSPLNRTKRR